MEGFCKLCGIGQCVILCCECCLGCLENICHYVNDHALSYMSISGEKFCASAWKGFLLHLKHLIEFEFVYFIQTLINFIFIVFFVIANCISIILLEKYT